MNFDFAVRQRASKVIKQLLASQVIVAIDLNDSRIQCSDGMQRFFTQTDRVQHDARTVWGTSCIITAEKNRKALEHMDANNHDRMAHYLRLPQAARATRKAEDFLLESGLGSMGSPGDQTLAADRRTPSHPLSRFDRIQTITTRQQTPSG